ncbi:uncharacterized protein LOC135501020 [Lineus longissimus]|uniref:uncharacterized protein LOC135501020 n=1 Tax=Lineus longissimus TaxID=88925 RepID=UPI00315DF297
MQKLIFVLVCVAAAVQADLKVGLQRSLVQKFNTSEQVLLQNLQEKFFAWKDSATPSDQTLMAEITDEIEVALVTLYRKCERLAAKAGMSEIPEAIKLAIEKKFNSTGYGMRDEIVALFQAYLGDRDEVKLFAAVKQRVPMRMGQLMKKIEIVVEKAENQGNKGSNNGGNNGDNNGQGGMTPELEGNISDMFNTTKSSLLGELQGRFEAWRDSPTPNDQVLIQETTDVIEGFLINLFQSGEQYIMESGNYNTEEIPSDAKTALEKKFNSTGYGMRDEIVAAFRTYLGDRDEGKLFAFVENTVPKRMDALMSKVEQVVGNAAKYDKPTQGNGNNNGGGQEQGGMTPELEGNISDMFNTTKSSLLGELQGRFEAWRDSPNPNDQVLIQETTDVIEGFLINLFQSGEQYIMESGNYNTEEIPSDAKTALEKKFNSTGYGMRDEIVAAFRTYLGDRDEGKLFAFVENTVPKRMDALMSKVEQVVGNAAKYDKPTQGNGNNNGGGQEQGGMTPELEGNISDMFNTTKSSLLGELQGRFEAWRDSPNPNDQVLIQETTDVIEGFLTNLFQSGEQYIMESGNYNTEEIPSDAKTALEKKFNSTGYGMRDEIVAAFKTYLGDRDEGKLFAFVENTVPKKMDQLQSKVEGVVGQANKFNPSKGGETKVDGLSDKTSDDLASRFSGSLQALLDDMQTVFVDWQSHGNDAKLMKVVEKKLNKQLTSAHNKAARLMKMVNNGKKLSSKVKAELAKKFSSTGQKMVDEVKGAFETFLQDKDQETMFSNVESIVRMRFGNLETKVQGVVKKVE